MASRVLKELNTVPHRSTDLLKGRAISSYQASISMDMVSLGINPSRLLWLREGAFFAKTTPFFARAVTDTIFPHSYYTR